MDSVITALECICLWRSMRMILIATNHISYINWPHSLAYLMTLSGRTCVGQKITICIDIQYCLVYCCPVLINTSLVRVTSSEFILQFIFIQKTAILINIADQKGNMSMDYLIDHDFIDSFINSSIYVYIAIIALIQLIIFFSISILHK